MRGRASVSAGPARTHCTPTPHSCTATPPGSEGSPGTASPDDDASAREPAQTDRSGARDGLPLRRWSRRPERRRSRRHDWRVTGVGMIPPVRAGPMGGRATGQAPIGHPGSDDRPGRSGTGFHDRIKSPTSRRAVGPALASRGIRCCQYHRQTRDRQVAVDQVGGTIAARPMRSRVRLAPASSVAAVARICASR